MTHRRIRIRIRSIAAAAVAVPIFAACTPQGGGGSGNPGPPVTDAVTVEFDRVAVSLPYCITAGNSAGTIIVDIMRANTTITGNIIGVAFDGGPSGPVSVAQSAVSDPYTIGSCHTLTLTRLVSPSTTLSADLLVTH